MKTVFTNGCFDILHVGHIRYLREAKKLGDKLVVGLNSDESIRRLKGKLRPINKQNARKELLESLKFVDEVVIFKEDDPLRLIKSIKPDVLVKGSDYKKKDIVGAEFVKSYGGKIVTVKFHKGYSTTESIKKIKAG